MKRLTEAAQIGGLRIKCFIPDSAATLLAYGLDTPSTSAGPLRTLVLDVGWSKTVVSLFDVSGGLLFPVSRRQSTAVAGSAFVQLLADFCAKVFLSSLSGWFSYRLVTSLRKQDFTRKTKIPLNAESSRSMLRLKRECEQAVKSLSTGQEATIDIDSLCEGADYSCKISRARFEDLLASPLVQLRNMLNEAAAEGSVGQLCLSGGLAAVPRIVQTAKALFPHAGIASSKGRFETSEAQCIGAAIHGKQLIQQVYALLQAFFVVVITKSFYT